MHVAPWSCVLVVGGRAGRPRDTPRVTGRGVVHADEVGSARLSGGAWIGSEGERNETLLI